MPTQLNVKYCNGCDKQCELGYKTVIFKTINVRHILPTIDKETIIAYNDKNGHQKRCTKEKIRCTEEAIELAEKISKLCPNYKIR